MSLIISILLYRLKKAKGKTSFCKLLKNLKTWKAPYDSSKMQLSANNPKEQTISISQLLSESQLFTSFL